VARCWERAGGGRDLHSSRLLWGGFSEGGRRDKGITVEPIDEIYRKWGVGGGVGAENLVSRGADLCRREKGVLVSRTRRSSPRRTREQQGNTFQMLLMREVHYS